MGESTGGQFIGSLMVAIVACTIWYNVGAKDGEKEVAKLQADFAGTKCARYHPDTGIFEILGEDTK